MTKQKLILKAFCFVNLVSYILMFHQSFKQLLQSEEK